jgi:hypothetical protein
VNEIHTERGAEADNLPKYKTNTLHSYTVRKKVNEIHTEGGLTGKLR